MWGDWAKRGPKSVDGVLNMDPPHKRDVFYTWWKHTPPQHPVLACHRPDTLYVVMVRHPKAWQESMKRKLYDLKFFSEIKLWRLIRSNPRRMPPMEMQFRSLYNVWEYYVTGYLAWEKLSVGTSCNSVNGQSGGMEERKNCIGGANKIPESGRNILVVRYEDYLMEPKKVLVRIFAFATRGLINAKMDEDKFVPHDSSNLRKNTHKLTGLQGKEFFSAQTEEWQGAAKLSELCIQLGYSCNESGELYLNQ